MAFFAISMFSDPCELLPVFTLSERCATFEGNDMLLDNFTCIVLISIPLHHPDGQHFCLGREHGTTANPLAPAVKHEGTDGTKRRGTNAALEVGEVRLNPGPGASPRLKSPPPRDTPSPTPRPPDPPPPATTSGTKGSS